MPVFWTFAYLSALGIMLVLQIQHFRLYLYAGRDSFADYIKANNRTAVFPAVADLASARGGPSQRCERT